SFQKNCVALAGLQNVSADNGIARCGWRSATGEGVGPLVVGEVVKTAPADVWNVDAEAELVPGVGIGGKVSPVEVIFSAAGIGLGAAGGEESGDCDLRVRGYAVRGIVIVADQEPQLIQPVRRELVEMADVDFVLEKVCVGAGGGQRSAADVLILDGAVLVGIADPELIAVRQIVED